MKHRRMKRLIGRMAVIVAVALATAGRAAEGTGRSQEGAGGRR